MNLKPRAIIYSLLLITMANVISAGSGLKNGFAALKEYNYFEARKIFYRSLGKSDNAYASYGLALIFSRNDNPFTNYDSAAKYVNRSFSAYVSKPEKQNLSGFIIDSLGIRNLADTIAFRSFVKSGNFTVPEKADSFLTRNYLATTALLYKVISLRDDLEYNSVISKSNSDSTLRFIHTHPESILLSEATLLYQRQLYEEYTGSGLAEDYKKFIAVYPDNVMVKEAHESLFRIHKGNNDSEGLKDFIQSYPSAPQIKEAWKLLFSLTVKTFSNKELEKFLKEYPAFPFRNSIQKELELNRLVLYPFEKNELFGFIDSTGKIRIKPDYESVTGFYEGLSIVSKNDSVFYVNKDNVNPFDEYFTDAYPFFNGMAAVKKNHHWFFINRQGQIISLPYEEINELSSNCYVVKQNGRYGAVSSTGQTIIEPRFQKLGDFKNDFAYFNEGSKYGFVSKNGFITKALYDWISEFSEGIAIVKVSEQYGIINSRGNFILEPEFDLILRAPDNIFIVVKDTKYGFYSGAGCFMSQIAYDFIKEKPAEYYSNGKSFRLIRKTSQTLMDANGRQLTAFDEFDEIGFNSDGFYRVRKNKKYGFADKKFNLAIPLKYENAGDFSDSLALVKIKDKYAVINLSGKEVFSSDLPIAKLSGKYFLEGEEENRNLFSNKGTLLFSGINSVQRLSKDRLLFTLNNGEIKLISD